jgi:hypothetical protein
MQGQVGLIRGTRWKTRSSEIRMVQEEQDDIMYMVEPVQRDVSHQGAYWFSIKSKLCPSHNNLSGGCGLVKQLVKCSIYYNNLSCGRGLVQQVVKCSI